MDVDSVGIIATLRMYYQTHSKNIDKRGENSQSARRKPNYRTKCGKNCHKILSVDARLVVISGRLLRTNKITLLYLWMEQTIPEMMLKKLLQGHDKRLNTLGISSKI